MTSLYSDEITPEKFITEIKKSSKTLEYIDIRSDWIHDMPEELLQCTKLHTLKVRGLRWSLTCKYLPPSIERITLQGWGNMFFRCIPMALPNLKKITVYIDDDTDIETLLSHPNLKEMTIKYDYRDVIVDPNWAPKYSETLQRDINVDKCYIDYDNDLIRIFLNH